MASIEKSIAITPEQLKMFHPKGHELLIQKKVPVEKWILLLDPDTGTVHFRLDGSLFNIYETLAESHIPHAR